MLVEHVVDLTPVIGDAAHDLDGVVGKRGLRTRLFDALSKKGQEILSLLVRLIQRVQSLLRAVERAMEACCPYSQFSRPR